MLEVHGERLGDDERREQRRPRHRCPDQRSGVEEQHREHERTRGSGGRHEGDRQFAHSVQGRVGIHARARGHRTLIGVKSCCSSSCPTSSFLTSSFLTTWCPTSSCPTSSCPPSRRRSSSFRSSSCLTSSCPTMPFRPSRWCTSSPPSTRRRSRCRPATSYPPSWRAPRSTA